MCFAPIKLIYQEMLDDFEPYYRGGLRLGIEIAMVDASGGFVEVVVDIQVLMRFPA